MLAWTTLLSSLISSQSGFGIVSGRARDLESDVLSVSLSRESQTGGADPNLACARRCIAGAVFFANLDGVIATLAVLVFPSPPSSAVLICSPPSEDESWTHVAGAGCEFW